MSRWGVQGQAEFKIGTCRYLLHLAQSHNVDALALLATKTVKVKKRLPAESAGLGPFISSACRACMQPSLSLLEQRVKDFALLPEEVS